MISLRTNCEGFSSLFLKAFGLFIWLPDSSKWILEIVEAFPNCHYALRYIIIHFLPSISLVKRVKKLSAKSKRTYPKHVGFCRGRTNLLEAHPSSSYPCPRRTTLQLQMWQSCMHVREVLMCQGDCIFPPLHTVMLTLFRGLDERWRILCKALAGLFCASIGSLNDMWSITLSHSI